MVYIVLIILYLSPAREKKQIHTQHTHNEYIQNTPPQIVIASMCDKGSWLPQVGNVFYNSVASALMWM